MKKSKNTEKNQDTEQKYKCDFCKRSFVLEKTMYTHMCENKRRWEDKDKPSSRIAYNAWTKFCFYLPPTKNPRTYVDFVKSPYYTYFIKYSEYCINVKCFSTLVYFDWILKNKIKFTDWTSDSVYTKFLIEYLKTENHLDAIHRSIQTLRDLSDNTGIKDCDYLKWGNLNKICYNITTGKISPWLLFNSNSGHEFLSKLDQSQTKMIYDYIEPSVWDNIFTKRHNDVNEVKTLLKDGGY